MKRTRAPWQLVAAGILAAAAVVSAAENQPTSSAGIYRGVSHAIRFDVSPPLRDIPPIEPIPGLSLQLRREGRPGEDLNKTLGPQSVDLLVQDWIGSGEIPVPSVSFNGPANVSGVAPPDPVGDVGPNHYVAMSNLSFQVFDKSGASVYGPALNNTLWSGFGGACQTENSGDPVVLYDQFADRWLLTQFTAAGPTFYNCVALSTTNDPTGTYYRWAFTTGTNFPDYPKYGVWSDAYYISTREFSSAGPFAGVGAYALNRTQMIAGNPAAQVISFVVPPAGGGANVGDGLLPADIDGPVLPPAGTPEFFVGSQDDGGPYGAASDAINLFKFHVDFAVPGNSTFTLTDTIPVGAFDSMAAFCSGRSCIPQPGTGNKIDHLGYRQRPLHRAAYRNFGDHEAIVTNQSVEATPTLSGIRWWEIRSPNASPVIYQEGTYAPADGVHRWMGSNAQDSEGNMALGFSVSNGTAVFPGSRYTGRLAADPLGTLPQGEGTIITGTGSQTGGGNRWGDYTSMNVDPIDDCTFWYVNEWVPTTSASGWQLRIGAFKFDECGTPDFYLSPSPHDQSICAGTDATIGVSVGSIAGFTNPVTLVASGNPAPSTTAFSVNPVTPPGPTTLTIGNTATVAAGTYPIQISGTATASPGHLTNANVTVYSAAPAPGALTSPPNGALAQPLRPTFQWTAVADAESYHLQVSTDATFVTTAIDQAGIVGTSFTPAADLIGNKHYYWRVAAVNACGTGTYSGNFDFFTAAAPGECGLGARPVLHWNEGFEAGAGGFTSAGTGNTWAISGVRVHSGVSSFKANDPATSSDQQLSSPSIVLPSGPVLTLQFWNHQTMEPRSGGCWDGGLLEISTDGGTVWNQVPTGSMVSDPYNGPLGSGNPLAPRDAWCGDPQDWLNSVVDIQSYAGMTVRFRFRMSSDGSVSREGWYIDDLKVQSCVASLFYDGFEDGNVSQWNGGSL